MRNEEPIVQRAPRPIRAYKEPMGHKERMADRKRRRKEAEEYIPTGNHIFANLSKNHPNYGETPQEQAERMKK